MATFFYNYNLVCVCVCAQLLTTASCAQLGLTQDSLNDCAFEIIQTKQLKQKKTREETQKNRYALAAVTVCARSEPVIGLNLKPSLWLVAQEMAILFLVPDTQCSKAPGHLS